MIVSMFRSRLAPRAYQCACRRVALLLGIVFSFFYDVCADEADGAYAAARADLVRAIEADVEDTRQYLGVDTLSGPVLDAMAKVPRHAFVPPELREAAYENRPLPIGHGQTISQPYIVAIMTELLGVEPGARVLEVGTGSGYQAAVLSEIGVSVKTIEIVEPLAVEAKERLRSLGYENAQVRHGDGYYGWSEAAPFDGIIVTAAASHVPPPLIEQLKSGGRMVIPVGNRFTVQQLLVVRKASDGSVATRQVLPVRFVPLTGGPG